MNPVINLAQTETRAPRHRMDAELAPLGQHVFERLLARPAIEADHHHVDRGRRLHAGVRQQAGHEFLLINLRRFGFKHQTHRCVLAGFVTHHIE